MRADLPTRWLVLPPDGWAQVVSDGEKVWVEVGRSSVVLLFYPDKQRNNIPDQMEIYTNM